MSQHHRHLDHYYQAARRETNYALFGNSRGEMMQAPPTIWGPAPTKEERRAERWRIRFICHDVSRRRGLRYFDQRKMDEAWLRYKELEPLAWNEKGDA